MQIDVPNMTQELLEQLERVLTRPAVAHDEGTALFSQVESIGQSQMSKLARQYGGCVQAIIRSEGEVVTMKDGRNYKVGPNGQWIRLDPVPPP